MSYKHTLNLPQTEMPMRANLPAREPQWLAFWEKHRIYEKAQLGKKETFILHDGPPFSNGHIHLGHAINKILKDIIVKLQLMLGKRAPFVPGWDNHGLPTEILALKTIEAKEKKKDPVFVRKLCRELAEKYVKIQKEEFKRLGLFAYWETPYLTMDPSYEARVLQAFFELYDKGLLTLRKKPVYWCFSCETALAEAEIEYAEKDTPSIYVTLPLKGNLAGEERAQLLIWTTTPWTLPANVAVAVHPGLTYALVRGLSSHPVLVAIDLLDELIHKKSVPEQEIVLLKEFAGNDLSGLIYKRPFSEKPGRVVTTEFVSKETGTGLVHIAPGHGEEDYQIGLKNNLEMICEVDEKGKFTRGFPMCEGEHVFAANEKIIEALQRKGQLFFCERIKHSYPHCWRCRSPVIFRATTQWFYLVDKARQQALEWVERVSWEPPQGKERIKSMIEARPDWCLSRQRYWGVFIPQYQCPRCGRRILVQDRKALLDKVLREGTDWWFEQEVEEGSTCEACGHKPLQRGKDILDVWFDSGVSHLAVLEQDERLDWPADLYVEGSDQHRGWFQQSLWVSIGIKGKAPYAKVLTHGFTVDEKGQKMSKSLGNVIEPQEVTRKFGADVLRLWVALSDYRADVKISENILKQVVEVYKKLRYTLRFLLSNLYDFSQSKRVPLDELEDTDLFILSELNELIERARRDYLNERFHHVAHSLHHFCVHSLSNFYLDITKDRLYTYLPDDPRRRKAQTVYDKCLFALVRLLAPILPFTAEETYQLIPWKQKESVFLELLPDPLPLPENGEKTRSCFHYRGKVFAKVEELKKQGEVNEPLACRVVIADPNFKSLDKEFLREILRVAEVVVKEGKGEIQVEPSGFSRCARCWNYKKDVKEKLCSFCVNILELKAAR